LELKRDASDSGFFRFVSFSFLLCFVFVDTVMVFLSSLAVFERESS